ncbi:MAG: protein kinase domain-containing protein, partial [Synechococcales cyanobacterium]
MSNLFIGITLSSQYLIQSQLSKGVFGETYLARDLQRPMQPYCIVKRLTIHSQNPQEVSIARRFFNQEAVILERIGIHDRIPKLLAYFEQNDEFYLVQEYIEGMDLESEGERLDERRTIDLIREVLEILEFVHKSGVIHRNIKPSNLIRRKMDGKLMLIDFGAVKQIYAQSTVGTTHKHSTVSIGTPGYMPSEQAAGNPRFCSDIYAVGVLGIQALTRVNVPESIPKDVDTDELQWRGLVQTAVSEGLERI